METKFIILAGLICIAMRVVPALLLRNVTVPKDVYMIMKFIPVTIFTAMIALDVFYWNGHFNLNPFTNIKLISALAAGLVAWKTQSIIPTVIVGVVVISLLYVAFR